jgi:hypothetical protein
MAKAKSEHVAEQQPLGRSAELFALVAGTIGLIVDLVGFVGIVSGFVTIPAASFFGTHPAALAVVTFFGLAYTIILFLYALRVALMRRWFAQNALPAEAEASSFFRGVAQLVWLPLFWLWVVSIWQVGGDAVYPGETKGFLGFLLFVLAAMGSLGGGELCDEASSTADQVLNPSKHRMVLDARRK